MFLSLGKGVATLFLFPEHLPPPQSDLFSSSTVIFRRALSTPAHLLPRRRHIALRRRSQGLDTLLQLHPSARTTSSSLPIKFNINSWAWCAPLKIIPYETIFALTPTWPTFVSSSRHGASSMRPKPLGAIVALMSSFAHGLRPPNSVAV